MNRHVTKDQSEDQNEWHSRGGGMSDGNALKNHFEPPGEKSGFSVGCTIYKNIREKEPSSLYIYYRTSGMCICLLKEKIRRVTLRAGRKCPKLHSAEALKRQYLENGKEIRISDFRFLLSGWKTRHIAISKRIGEKKIFDP